MAASIGSLAPTYPLYQYDETVREHNTTLLSILPSSSLPESYVSLLKPPPDTPTYVIVTPSTIFYAQGGGQPSDIGVMKLLDGSSKESHEFTVKFVRTAPTGQILHLGTISPPPASPEDLTPWTPGSAILQQVDGATRLLHSRIHTAGHLVSIAIRHLIDPSVLSPSSTPAAIPTTPSNPISELKAQHTPGASYVVFKGLIEGKYLGDIQNKVSEFVKAELPIQLYWMTEQEARDKCLMVMEGALEAAKPPSAASSSSSSDPATESAPSAQIRVVDIVGGGAYPCGGTHVQHSGLCGDVKIKKISRAKGETRISYTV